MHVEQLCSLLLQQAQVQTVRQKGDLIKDAHRLANQAVSQKGSWSFFAEGLIIAPLPALQKSNQDHYYVEKIVKAETRKIKGRNLKGFIVKWLGYPESDNTFEPRSTLIKDVPDLVEQFEQKLKI